MSRCHGRRETALEQAEIVPSFGDESLALRSAIVTVGCSRVDRSAVVELGGVERQIGHVIRARIGQAGVWLSTLEGACPSCRVAEIAGRNPFITSLIGNEKKEKYERGQDMSGSYTQAALCLGEGGCSSP